MYKRPETFPRLYNHFSADQSRAGKGQEQKVLGEYWEGVKAALGFVPGKPFVQ